MKHYDIKSRRRADIIIDGYDKRTNTFKPIAAIECKASDVALDDKSFEQIFDYADKLGCGYCWLTNGEELCHTIAFGLLTTKKL